MNINEMTRDASFSLGVVYATGMGVPADDQKAVYWYRQAAEQGHADAQFRLGAMYARGQGVPADDREAVFWYGEAAGQGHADAQFWLGYSHASGKGVAADDREAVFWYSKAAGQGHADAQFWLGYSHASGKGVAADDREAVFWYREAAEQGHADAQFELGLSYTIGGGVAEDDQEAVFWYRKAAEQGHVEAQFWLGAMHNSGRGVAEDDQEAVFWYRKAAEQGHAGGQYRLGFMHWLAFLNGIAGDDGTAYDDQEAVFWYRKAAEQGHEEAQFWLGRMYANGWGVPADDREAAFWCRKAAEQGHAGAQLELGRSYANGRGVPADKWEAASWYRKAAEQGLANAQLELGRSYAGGKGVPEDDVQAYAWINLACVQRGEDDEDAQQHRTDLRQRMTSAQLAEAQKLSRQLAAWIEDGGDEPTLAAISSGPVRSSAPSHDMVRPAQSYLAMLGYDTGSMDGLFGERTTAAVQQFQQDMGIRSTGLISEELLALLRTMADARQKQTREPASSGSGFLVGRDGWIVTNHHVVDGCARVTVNHAGTSYDATVRAVEARDDLALLKAPVEVRGAATFSESPRASLGEAATVAGYPLHGVLSKELNVTSGNVSALAGPDDDAKRLQITAPVQPGNSGGPLLDGAGNVIGVVASTLRATHAAGITGDIPQNVNFAIKGAVVRSFLDIHGVAYNRRPSSANLAPEQLAELARTFTVAVHCWE